MGACIYNRSLGVLLAGLCSSAAFAKTQFPEAFCKLEPKCLGLRKVKNHNTLYLTNAIEKDEEIAHPKTKSSSISLGAPKNSAEEKRAAQECFEKAINASIFLEDLTKNFFDPPIYTDPDQENESDNSVACLAFVKWTYSDSKQSLSGKVSGNTPEAFKRLSDSQIQLNITGDHRYKFTDYPSKKWLVPFKKVQ